MKTFAQNLTEARQAAGMTQAELAEAAHVARNTISGWEHGRSVPSIDMMRQISAILKCNLLEGVVSFSQPSQEEGGQAEPVREPEQAASVPVPEETAPAPAEPAPVPTSGAARKKPSWKVILPAVTLLAVIVVAGILLLTSRTPSDYRDAAGTVYRPEDYAVETPRQEGKPYLVISKKLETTGTGTPGLYMFTFTISEETGIPLTITRLDYNYFNAAKRTAYMTAVTKEQLPGIGVDPEIKAHGVFDFVGGFPIDSGFTGVGFRLYVQDETGEEYVFNAYQPIGEVK